jgi:hypothetical protein
VGQIVMTAQEAPQTTKPLRDDLYKKMLSGDPIMARKPYGSTTRMVPIIGWKRGGPSTVARSCDDPQNGTKCMSWKYALL